MIIEGGRARYRIGFQFGILAFSWPFGYGRKILFPNGGIWLDKLGMILVLIMLTSQQIIAQNCDINFPGTSVLAYSSECGGGGTSDNLTIGKNVHLDDNDIFTFDAPATIHITGNLNINARGSGRIIIPAGITVIVDGNVQFDTSNGGCEGGDPCNFNFLVEGYLIVGQVLQNNINSLAWEGSGTVEVRDKLENSSNGCMSCGVTCPDFPAGVGGCVDAGVGCPTNFCNSHYGVICSNDKVDPVLSNCPADIIISAASNSCDGVASWTPPTPSDNCSVASFTSSHTPGDTFPMGITTVTYKVEDAQGNSSTCNFTVEVIDDLEPIITNCPADQIISATDCANTKVSWIPPSVADNCTVVGFNGSHFPGQTFPLGITTVTYSATDIFGNIASCSFQVELIDDISPVISNCPADITMSIPASACDVSVNWTPPLVSDNCGLASFSSSHNPGDTFPLGTTSVTYNALDNHGNATSCSFQVTVIDTTDPVITACPSNITLSATSCAGAVASWTPPTVVDNCSMASFTSSHNPGDNFPLGQTTVSYTATDDQGNTVTCSFEVEIVDDAGPAITGCPADMLISVADCAAAAVSWVPPVATDNCNVASFSSNHSPGEIFDLGITTVTYTAVDDNGNTASCSFQVELMDNTAPVINNCPANMLVSSSGLNCDARVVWAPPLATDNCSLLSFSGSHQPGDRFPTGTTTVTYTASDMSGNITTCSMDITVTDKAPPLISNCPDDILVSGLDPGQNTAVVTWNEPDASDDCALATFTSSHKSGTAFPTGQTVVTYRAVDEAGNEQTCSFTIEVMNNKSPMVENLLVQTYSSEPVRICFDAIDPDGDDMNLGNVQYNTLLGTIDQIDPALHCFVYTPTTGSTGMAVVDATICDDRSPEACVDVQVKIEVLSEDIIIYKAFSPNGDGINDLWHIGNIEQYPENSVIIFDRWGSIIFETANYNNENIVWDGRANSSRASTNGIVPPGTYYFSIQLTGKNSIKGYIEVIN